MSQNGQYEPGEDQLRQEFKDMVAVVVEDVHRHAANSVQRAGATVQEIRDELRGLAGDLRSQTHTLEETAGQARDALAPITQLGWQVESLNRTFTQKATELSQRLDGLQGQVRAAASQTEALRQQTQTVDQSWRQALIDLEKRQKRFFMTIGMFLIGTGIILWAAIGILIVARVLRLGP